MPSLKLFFRRFVKIICGVCVQHWSCAAGHAEAVDLLLVNPASYLQNSHAARLFATLRARAPARAN